eukprot:355821-Chlamydomonas_euryale.AAC.5
MAGSHTAARAPHNRPATRPPWRRTCPATPRGSTPRSCYRLPAWRTGRAPRAVPPGPGPAPSGAPTCAMPRGSPAPCALLRLPGPTSARAATC